MSWRVTSEADPTRFVAWDGEGLVTDERTRLELEELVDSAATVALTITGPFRDVETLDDELGVFLFAMQAAVPPPITITGTPPAGPAAEVPEEATP